MAKKKLFPKLKGTLLQDFTPTDSVSELQIIDIKKGSDDAIEVGDTSRVRVHYTGARVNDGVIFESSLDSSSPITFGVHEVIEGWTIGLQGMKEGGVRRLIIPHDQAYGAHSPSKDIPKYSDLVFDIELFGVL